MLDYNIVLPSQPKVIREEGFTGVYEVDGLYPGYGHTLGNSIRRIILSSLPGSAITAVKIDGVNHEFATLKGVKEDVIRILLNLKKVRIKMLTDEPQILKLKVTGPKSVTAADLQVPGQVEVLNLEQEIATLSDKNAELDMELTVEKGIGYIPKEVLQKDRVDIGIVALDAIFTPIRRVNYEVENMRVGDRTDFNKLRISIETDGIVMPREALEQAIEIMINQLKAIVGFQEDEPVTDTMTDVVDEVEGESEEVSSNDTEIDTELLKTRIEELGLSARTGNALAGANIRTVGGLVRKAEDEVLSLEGMGAKGVEEIKEALTKLGVGFKD
ncbi:DNA-directed RNA polymerase subunit alpha [Candidatus Wolfebacteria bacterium]|nr:MAG: DNA-directed RNA polymerase subunit alpha [Candidatus Wolfebacteria bacterium]